MRDLVFVFFIMLVLVNMLALWFGSLRFLTILSVLTNLCLVMVGYWLMCDEEKMAELSNMVHELHGKLTEQQDQGE